MRHAIRLELLIAAFASSAACARPSRGTSTTQPTPPASPATTAPVAARPPDSTAWVTSDSAGKTATISLQVTRPSEAGSALLNGYGAGEARFVVPLGWTVRWSWRNADSTTPHSLVVMVQREKIPLEGGRPAFSNAMTKLVTSGLAAGQTDQTTFEAEEAGWYWLLCGVPEHALAGEWLELRVDPEAKSATLQTKNVSGKQ